MRSFFATSVLHVLNFSTNENVRPLTVPLGQELQRLGSIVLYDLLFFNNIHFVGLGGNIRAHNGYCGR